MKKVPAGEPSPASTDIEGWRRAIAEGAHIGFRLEALVAALQDLGPQADGNVKRALVKQLNDAMLRMLRSFVGFNHPNQGEDVIYRVHHQLFDALLRPKSADGHALRAGFANIVSYRVKDAIAMEYRHSRIPIRPGVKDSDDDELDDELPVAANDRTPPPALPDGAEDRARELGADKSTLDDAPDLGEQGDPADVSDGEDAPGWDSNRNMTLLDGVRNVDEQLDVVRILSDVTDHRKRLAFYLHMQGVPFGSTKGNSIAKALGKSKKTVTDWVEEVRAQLKTNKEVQDLRKLSVGEKP
jgi:hypothetical protein